MALGYMRRHRKWLYGSLWLTILGFIVFYIPAFRGADSGSPGEAVGYVGGEKIAAGDFQRAYLQRRRVYEELYQGKLDAAGIKSLGIENQVFENLVAEKLLQQEAKRLGLGVSDAELAKSLETAPDLQENGRFIGVAELKRRLALGGTSVADFEASRREQLLVSKLQDLLTAGVSVSPAEVEREFRRRTEQVKAEYVLVDTARFKGQVKVTDEEVKARFEARKAAYQIPEKRVVSYALLDADAMRSRVSVTDEDVASYYEEHKDDFLEPEEVCASHVLIKVKSSSQAEGHEDAEAKRLAEDVLAKLKAGADFASVAKKYSEDKGSASQGGDLGCFPRGRMVPGFDAAAFALDAGQISDLVKTSFGYHVIRVSSKRPEQTRPLEAVKGQIHETLLRERVSELIEKQSEAIGAALQRGRSLAEAAQAEGVSVQKSAPFAKGETPDPLASPELSARAFQLKPGEVEKAPFALPRGEAFIALDEILPPHAPELKEVQDKVKADLLAEQALERARLLAVEVEKRAEKQGLERAASALGLVRKETPGLVGRGQPIGDLGTGAALEDAVFALEPKTLSEPVRVRAGYAVLRVLDKKPFDPAAFEKQKASIAAALRQARRGQLFQSFLNAARERTSVERRPEVMRRLVG
jgi:peptidyl-prolyl cis-trans isomerase D